MNRVPILADPDFLPDREILQMLDEYLVDSPEVDRTELDPDPNEPHKLKVDLDENHVTLPLSDPQLAVEWFVNGDFFIALTSTSNVGWQCEWHRHHSPSHSRTHFHCPPPDGRVKSLKLEAKNSIDVIATIIETIGHQD